MIDDVVLLDKPKKSSAVALDIINSMPDESDRTISGTGSFSDLQDSDITVVTASRGGIKKDRMDILRPNLKITDSICNSIKKHCIESKIIVITNPVDIITHYIMKNTGIPRERVIGVGSSLDSSRLRFLISRQLGVNQKRVEAVVMGEHGATMTPIYSSALLDKQFPITEMISEEKRKAVTRNLRNYWRKFRDAGIASVFGISKHAYDVIHSIKCNTRLTIPCSVALRGEYGMEGVSIGVPVTIDSKGINTIKQIEMSGKEREDLVKSYQKVKHVLGQISS